MNDKELDKNLKETVAQNIFEGNEEFEKYKKLFASLGGKARAKKLSKKRRKEISDLAIKARWGKDK